jgi:hypothetical protein
MRLSSSAMLSFEGGSVRYDYVDSPLFWAADARNIEIRDADIRFSGRMPLHTPAQLPAFYDQYLRRRRAMAGRDLMAAFAFMGVEDVRIIRPRFQALTMAADTLIIRCISIGEHDDGRPSRNITIEDFQADGFYMGILGWGIDGLTIRGMRTKRWGQLNTTKYAWDCPAHPIYIAPRSPSRNVVCTDLVDEGLEVSPWLGAGSTSFKFTGVAEGLRLGRLHSRRSAGLLDFHGRDFLITDLDWAGDNPQAIAANKVIRGVPYTKAPEEFSNGVIRNVSLSLPHEMDDYAVALGFKDPRNVDRCRFENWRLRLPGARQRPSTPLIVGSMSRCTWSDIQVSAPSVQGDLIAMRIDSGGGGNKIDLRTDTPARVRLIGAERSRVQMSRL